MNILLKISRLHFASLEKRISAKPKIRANLPNFSIIHKNSILLQMWKRFCKFVDYFVYGKGAGKYQNQ